MVARKEKVFVGMSGGVDSSVAAGVLKERGYDVVGVHLRCWYWDAAHLVGEPRLAEARRGCAETDAEDARRAAEVLGIPFYVLDFEKEYKRKVVDYMIDGYRKGITPNPDVMCNKEIKFGLFFEKAMQMGADYVATGHYVRLRTRKNILSSTRFVPPGVRDSLVPRLARPPAGGHHARSPAQVSDKNIFSLWSAKDQSKDQSYFLWTLTQKQLAHCLFPIGEYIKKTEVRKLAKKFGLLNAEKKDSQGICFLGKVTITDFLKTYIPERKGMVVNTAGEVMGKHKGAHFYTIGQRSGIGVSGFSRPYYVAEKDVKKNIIRVAEENDSALSRKEIQLTNVNFIRPLPSLISAAVKTSADKRAPARHSRAEGGNKRIDVLARVRYRQPLAKATLVISNQEQVTSKKQSKKNSLVTSYRLLFAGPQKFIAPGQSAVFYERKGNPSTSSGSNPSLDLGFEMLGGGVIA